MLNKPNLDFSFSGLKTAVYYALQDLRKQLQDETGDDELSPVLKQDIAASFQQAVVETLIGKVKKALKQTGHTQVVVAGGVGANKQLREDLNTLMNKLGGKVFYPRHEFCTDNGAMIAYAGWQRLQAGERVPHKARPRWSIDEIKLTT